LPARHALNQMTLAATADVAIDARGSVVDVRLTSSGNADFDRALRQVIRDASPLPKPPVELWSDDDRVHLPWLFARDRRQAGPATASVIDLELPLRVVVERLVATNDLARAARRIARAPDGAVRDGVTRTLMVAVLREGLASSDGAVRRSAIEAISRAQIGELYGAVRDLVAATTDVDLRLVALQLELGSSEVLFDRLRVDLKTAPQLALAEARAIVRMGEQGTVAAILRAELAKDPPSPVAIAALGAAPLPELAAKLATWFGTGDARTRGAVCTALAAYPMTTAWPLLDKGLRDRDASVRASCVETARKQYAAGQSALVRVRGLQRDRDRTVRARAVAAIAHLDPDHLVNAIDDPSAEVRAAFAASLPMTTRGDATALLERLIDDRDPDVRAAAWSAFAPHAKSARKHQLAAHAAADSAPQVRRAALPAIDDDTVLMQLATRDESPEVRTAALVELADRRGRAAIADTLLDRLAAATPASGERVRTALAWLLAR
jgi:TonB family protein